MTRLMARLCQGNPDVHIILRGGNKGPNYAAEYVKDCGEKLKKAGLPQKIMVRVYLSIELPSLVDSFFAAARRSIAAMGTAKNNMKNRSRSPKILYVQLRSISAHVLTDISLLSLHRHVNSSLERHHP